MRTKKEKKEYGKKYYREHVEQAKKRKKIYEKKHPEKVRERQKRYRKRHIEEYREYQRKYIKKNAEKIRKRNRKYREKYSKEIKERYEKWYKKNPYYYAEKICKNRYGITFAEKNCMIENQKGKCLICGNKFKNSRDKQLDHCHRTNKVRGVLCVRCNTGLGFFDDNIETLQKAIKYLEKK